MIKFWRSQSGAGASEVIFIVGVAFYMTLIGYLANAMGYTTSMIGSPGAWSLPSVHMGEGWLAFITGTVDFFIAILNIFAWIIQSLVGFGAMIVFSVGHPGELPAWIPALFIAPFALGMVFILVSLVRGRE